MRSMLHKATLTGFAVLTAVLLSPGVAHAQTSFAAGNNPQTDENILLNSGLTGQTVFGAGNSTGRQVSFSVTDSTVEKGDLAAPASGQARVEATDGTLNNVGIQVVGGSFKTLIFNANNGAGDLVVDVSYLHNNTAGSQQFTLALGNGSNFGTLTTVNSQTVITGVVLTSSSGFADLRQVRLGGAALDSVTPQALVPEPASMAMALPGLFPVGLMFLRRRKKAGSA